MPSDLQTGSLMRTLVASKPAGKFLELGTGTGLSLSWIAEAMDKDSSAISIDNNEEFLSIAAKCFKEDNRIQLICTDGAKWIQENSSKRFDLIFADTWAGKYNLLDETLAMLKPGGLYVIDDMLRQSNWPEGHEEKANALIRELESRNDLWITEMNWSTGIVIASRK